MASKEVITTKTGYIMAALKKNQDKDLGSAALREEANKMREKDNQDPLSAAETLWALQSLTRQKLVRKAARKARKESAYGTGRKVNVFRLAKGWEKRYRA
jgi:pyruvate-formate lyase